MARKSLLKVFLTALVVRALYSYAAPAIYYFNADSIGYYSLGAAFFAHPSILTFITPYRTPVYPVFINAVMYMLGAGGTPFGSPAFLWGAQVIAAIQMIIGAIAFTAFYHAITRFIATRARLLFAVFLLCDVFVIGWERTLLTEGLAISVSLLITAVLLHIFFAPSGKKFLLLWFLFSFGFLLRPSFMVYPIATLPFVAWYFRTHARIVFLTCVTLAAAALIPLIYARINYTTVRYFGILFEGDIVVLGRILEFNIPVESAKNYTYFYSIVKDSRAGNAVAPTGFNLLFQYDPAIWDKAYRFVELQSFNRTVILNSLPLYVVQALRTIPVILLEVCEFTRVSPASPNLFTRAVWVLQQIYGYAQYATLAVPFLWILSGVVFLVKPTRWNAMIAAIGTIAVSQLLLTALMVYNDAGGQYQRVLSPVRPQLFLFLFLCTISCIRLYQKHQT